MTPREALVAALDAAQAAGTPAPCAPTNDASHAPQWDAIPHRGPNKPHAIGVRVKACKTRCPALTECDALRRDELARGLRPWGVIAGHIHGLSETRDGRPQNSTDPAAQAKVVAAYQAGASIKAAGAAAGVGQTAARTALRTAGVTPRPHGSTNPTRAAS